MKIVHIDFTGPYTDGATYQENILPALNAKDGHDVTLLVQASFWNGAKEEQITEESRLRYTSESGVKIIRLPYVTVLNRFVTSKVRLPVGLYDELERIAPNIIFMHCLQTMAGEVILKYLSNHPNTKLVVDSHSDYLNSARTFFSKHILHKIFYKKIVKDVSLAAKKIYAISPECKDFLIEMYGVKASDIEDLPLGGLLMSEQEMDRRRAEFREMHRISDGDVVYMHSGKLDRQKKTIETMRAFNRSAGSAEYLFIAGDVGKDIEKEFNAELVRNDRIQFLGWLSGEQLKTAICGSDVYLQPGSKSATAQISICCGKPVVLNNLPLYRELVDGNGWLIDGTSELEGIFEQIEQDRTIIKRMASESLRIARERLDYEKQARRYLNEVEDADN